MKLRRFYIFIAVFVVGLLSHLNAVAGTNRLLLQDVTMQNGGSAFLSFQLENDDPITGFQCDLYLPSGVSTDNYMDYVDALVRLMKDGLGEKLGSAARTRVMEQFSMPVYAKQMKDVLVQSLAR